MCVDSRCLVWRSKKKKKENSTEANANIGSNSRYVFCAASRHELACRCFIIDDADASVDFFLINMRCVFFLLPNHTNETIKRQPKIESNAIGKTHTPRGSDCEVNFE